VPTPNVSVVDLVAEVSRPVTGGRGERLRSARPRAGALKGILAVEDAPLVSIDFRGNSNSSIKSTRLPRRCSTVRW